MLTQEKKHKGQGALCMELPAHAHSWAPLAPLEAQNFPVLAGGIRKKTPEFNSLALTTLLQGKSEPEPKGWCRTCLLCKEEKVCK